MRVAKGFGEAYRELDLRPMSIALSDIQAAAERLKGQAVETPLIESPALNERLGGRVFLKPETLQRAGAFKFRGAYNRLSQLTDAEKSRGVVAFSSGNHAQGWRWRPSCWKSRP